MNAITETEFFAERGIVMVDDKKYSVPSSSGSAIYTVTWVGRTEDGFGHLWECSCPAGRHGKTCKHVRHVGSTAGQWNDANGWE